MLRACCLLTMAVLCWSVSLSAQPSIELKNSQLSIVVSSNESGAVRKAVEALSRDFEKVMGYKAPIVDKPSKSSTKAQIIIVNKENNSFALPKTLKELNGFEAHRVYADPSKNYIYLYGSDMRGTIYAIYTFSEQFLGVPPLWYFCSWVPQPKETITVAADYDYYQPSPQVRYRAWFPNDTDLLTPWKRLSRDNQQMYLETMLRLKLNTLELDATVVYPDQMTAPARLLSSYGLILTSHHYVALNTSWLNWKDYWEKVRNRPAPPLSLENEDAMREFWRHSVQTVYRNGIENLWLIAFRGAGDKAFWVTFKDAPSDEKQRAEIINKMLQIQLDIIKEVTKEQNPYVRMTFYDEMSDLLAAGYLKPPVGENMIWTYVAARRDHYPNDDLVNFDPSRSVKMGYYMNLQFTSSGAHLAQAEGPWKMEFNYRYVDSRSPLYFSVVNAGNIREFLFTMSANARMMWNFDAYSTESFVLDFCKQYFGDDHAAQAAQLYKDFFYSYWQQRPSEFEGLERQFIFQDLRYVRAIENIASRFFEFTPTPLRDTGLERMAGRTYRIAGTNQVDSLIKGMALTYPKFEDVARRALALYPQLPAQYRTFFRDNLMAQTIFMAAISRSLYYFTLAYKEQADKQECVKNLDMAIKFMQNAGNALYSTQEGVFETWYAGDTQSGKFNIPKTINLMKSIKDKIQ